MHDIQLNYDIYPGINTPERKHAIHLKKHILTKKFDFLEESNENNKECSDNPEEENSQMLEYIDNPTHEDEYLRSINCFMLIKKMQLTVEHCSECKCISLAQIKVINSKKVIGNTPAKVKAPIKFTSPKRIVLTLQQQRVENAALTREVQYEITNNSVSVDSNLHSDLQAIMKRVFDSASEKRKISLLCGSSLKSK